ncbi:MAG TPA: UDP-3-O-(3-hydroxymyristoyl)glucosamine N-acyltransferase [Acidobacteriaceae bacterium]
MTLAELARLLGAELHPGASPQPGPAADHSPAGAPHALPPFDPALVQITGVAGIETAAPHQLTFVANARYAPLAPTTRAGAILVERDFPAIPVPTLRLPNPYHAFARALELFYQPPSYPPGIHPTAVVDPSAQLAASVHLGPYVVVGARVTLGEHSVVLAHCVLYEGARIGSHFFAHAHAVVREHCIVGDHVTLQNGAIIGSDGFGFAKQASGWYKIPQSGHVVLEDHVEVQALACIDRASVGETRIGRGTKVDNLVQVGHGSTVGADTLLCAQVGLAGSTHVGRSVILAGQVGVAGHCTIGDGAVATAQSGIPGDVPAGAVVSGYPAIPNRQWLRASAVFQRLPETLRKFQKARKPDDL